MATEEPQIGLLMQLAWFLFSQSLIFNKWEEVYLFLWFLDCADTESLSNEI